MNKEQSSKINWNLLRLREGVRKPKPLLPLYGLGAVLIVSVLIFAYRPLIIELQKKNRELKSLSGQLEKQRSSIAELKTLDLRGRLMQQKELSFAIDELTEAARALGLKFTSITPQRLQQTGQDNVARLSINFKIESEYKSLGQFLSYLEVFSRTIAEVEALSIRPTQEGSSRLNIELLVNLYMEAKVTQ